MRSWKEESQSRTEAEMRSLSIRRAVLTVCRCLGRADTPARMSRTTELLWARSR